MQDDKKICTKCGAEKSAKDDFYWRIHRGKHEPFQPCKDCAKGQNNERYRSDAEFSGRVRHKSQVQARRRMEDPEFKQHCLEREQRWRDANRERVRQYYRDRRKRLPLNAMEGHLKRRYGIDLAEREAMIQAQDGKCAICQDELPARPHIDHDVVNGVVRIRGVLCQGCNQGLGIFKEDPDRMRAAIAYLETANQDKIESDLAG